jgi:hypothetical protein
MEHNKVLGKGRLDNYQSWMGLGIVIAGLAVTIVQSYCTITSYELGIVLLATGVAVVIIGGIWCGEESERDVVEKE